MASIAANRYGIEQAPAVVVDRSVVFRGETDLARVVKLWRERAARPGRESVPVGGGHGHPR